MRIETILFPKDKPREVVEPLIDRVFAAIKATDTYADPQAFMFNWAMLADNTRVFIGLDGDQPVAFAHMTFGRRFHDKGNTASVTILETKTQLQREFMLDHLRETATTLGATTLLYEGKPEDSFEAKAVKAPLRALALG